MSRKLYVTNVHPAVSRDELQGLFAAHGMIQSVAVIGQFKAPEEARVAFVEMQSDRDGGSAINRSKPGCPRSGAHDASSRRSTREMTIPDGSRSASASRATASSRRPARTSTYAALTSALGTALA